MTDMQIIFGIQFILFGVLLYTLYRISATGKINYVNKIVVAMCAMVILVLSDIYKLIAAVGMAGIIYTLKYIHHKKDQKHGTKHSW